MDALHDGQDLHYTLTRAQFEALNEPLFAQCIEHVRDVLRDAGLERSAIDEVVFVGGSTRIPRVQGKEWRITCYWARVNFFELPLGDCVPDRCAVSPANACGGLAKSIVFQEGFVG